jgi:hypothetical protein
MGSILRSEKMKSKLVSDLHLMLTDEGDVKETYISLNKDKNELLLKEICVPYEEYTDNDGNVEIYIPENEYHTGFYIKVPKNTKI